MYKGKIISTLLILVGAVGATTVAFGQGRYANTYSKAQVDTFVQQLESSSNAFRTDFRREINNSNLDSSTRRTYNNYASQFENAVDRLRNRFNSNNSWWGSRNEVRNLITNSQNINTAMNNASFRRNIERQWNRLRDDVNKLADTFDLPGLNGGGWNGNNGSYPQNGGNVYVPSSGRGRTSTPPTWSQGTFYGMAPNGSQITLTIARNGQVTADIGGSMSYGTYNRGILTMGYNTA